MAKLGPDVWGPHAWKFLHFVSLGYPDYPTNEDKFYKLIIPIVYRLPKKSNTYLMMSQFAKLLV